MKKEKVKTIVELSLVIFLFILTSFFAQDNIEFIRGLIKNDILGMIIYVVIVITAVVIAPISAFPLHPIAANLWGWFIAGILIWVGVCIGALIAFVISRKYGVRLVKKIISVEKIHKTEKKIPGKNIFLSLVFLRMILPIDIVSYFFGLFTNMRFSSYMIATIIGSMPLAFLSSYVGTLPWIFQIIAALLFLIIITIVTIVKILLKKR